MSLLIAFLTFILVVNCLFLMLLVLVQLPKKEAGAGLAFGAGAVDTLIGAGSGNALTKLTKYSAAVFLGLAVLLAILNAQRQSSSANSLKQELSRKSSTAAPMIPAAQPTTPAPSSGSLQGNPAPATTTPANNGTTTPVPLTLTPSPATEPAATATKTPPVTAPAGSQNATTAGAPNTPAPNGGTKQP